MSYSKFKNKEQHKEVFGVNSKIKNIGEYHDNKLNLILPSEHLFKSLKPVLEKMLGDKLDDKKVVLIPNGGIDGDRAHMSYVYLEQFTTINNMYLKQLDLDKWPEEILIQSLESCDVIVISGGLVSRLIDSIDKSGIRKKLVELIKNGKPLVGFSAGAMVLSKTTNFSEKFVGEEDRDVKDKEPLGIIDFEIYPHFEDNLYQQVKEILPKGLKGFALRPEDAIVITQGKLLGVGNPEYFE